MFILQCRLLWIFTGALYYTVHDGYDYYVALYRAVSIGWSIGWDMPYETDLSDKPASMTYSCFHNCMVRIIITSPLSLSLSFFLLLLRIAIHNYKERQYSLHNYMTKICSLYFI